MSTAQERLKAIQDNYDSASENEANDLAKTKLPEEVAAVQANVANARLAYYSAVTAMLTNSGDSVENAYEEAVKALATVKKARADAEQISKVIGKLGTATAKAADLLNKATKLA